MQAGRRGCARGPRAGRRGGGSGVAKAGAMAAAGNRRGRGGARLRKIAADGQGWKLRGSVEELIRKLKVGERVRARARCFYTCPPT